MKNSGERFTPYTSENKNEPILNLERYYYAMAQCKNKRVVDMGCGAGIGTYLYSLVAKSVVAIDYKDEAIDYAKRFPVENVEFLKLDMEKDNIPDGDILVAIEFLEHLENPERILQFGYPEIVFSVPMASLSVSTWHKYDFRDVGDIVTFFSKYYQIEIHNQSNLWIYGYGKLKS